MFRTARMALVMMLSSGLGPGLAVGLSAGVVFGVCVASPAPSESEEAVVRSVHVARDEGQPRARDVPDRAHVGGKYRELLDVVYAPEDAATYGGFVDYGVWGPGEWAGAMRPEGHWVYVEPRWYVWGRVVSETQGKVARADVEGDITNAYGKYAGLVKKVHAPADEATYGPYNDFGVWGPGQWVGEMQPRGYWVYSAPDWYIWREQR